MSVRGVDMGQSGMASAGCKKYVIKDVEIYRKVYNIIVVAFYYRAIHG
jgi:hypothetical protein